jgi:hypothetical protein
MIVLNERHLKRLMSEYVLYYHDDRTHLGLAKDRPEGRPTAIRPSARAGMLSVAPTLGKAKNHCAKVKSSKKPNVMRIARLHQKAHCGMCNRSLGKNHPAMNAMGK